jgi:hypothetical protein
MTVLRAPNDRTLARALRRPARFRGHRRFAVRAIADAAEHI